MKALMLEPIKQPHSSSLSHALYNHQVTLINPLLETNDISLQRQSETISTLPLYNDLKPLAHLTTKQLLTLLEEVLLPLLARHDYLLNQENDEASNTLLKTNQEKLLKIQQLIYQGLLARCQISMALKLPRHVDDVQRYFETKIDQVTIQKGTLDDDSRLLIYDILAAAGFDKAQLYCAIIEVIPKRTYQKIRDAKVVKKEVTDVYQFTQGVCDALCIKRKKPGRIQVFLQEAAIKGRALASTLGVQKLAIFWQWRYLFYFIFSFIAYYLLMQAITSVLALLLSAKALIVLSNVLFYSIALLPLWGFISQHVYFGFKQCINQKRAPKQNQIVESMLVLEQTQQLISYRLGQVIVDISHYDFDALTQVILYKRAAICELKKQLSHFSLFDKILVGAALKDQAKVVADRLEELESSLSKAVEALIKHMTLRVQEERTLLEASLDSQTLIPSFPSHQLKKVSDFIHKFGSQDQVRDFLKESHISHLWQKGLEQLILVDPASPCMLQQPFGTHILRQDMMKGWEILLNEWDDGSERSQSAMKLNRLLSGKKLLTTENLSQAVLQVAQNEEAAKALLAQIQLILFSTLSQRTPATAALLSQAQKDQISKWYRLQHAQTKKAHEILKEVFSNNVALLACYTNKELVAFYQALEGRDFFYFAKGQSHVKSVSQNQLRQYFERYRGQSSRAFLLLRFLPEQLKANMLVNVAKHRLAWIIAHLGKEVNPDKPFEVQDIELFLHHDLLIQHHRFNVVRAIIENDEFQQPYTQKMVRFLQSCRRHGLDTGQLLIEYQKRKRTAISENTLIPQYKQQQSIVKSFPQTLSKGGKICASRKIVV